MSVTSVVPTPAPIRVLVVEDDADVRHSVARLVGARGDEVVAVACCDEARAAQGDFDVGVFDVDLPDGDGVELAREMIADERVRQVVFHTGQQHDDALEVGPVVVKGSGDLLGAVEAARERLCEARER